ncbi:MAG TPA: cell wall-binding repeat-containing protein [Nitriliruptorales bacterium]|nr:cell wall-binding repeat-containing protein [Nitriliruptorales bacterium]
MTTVRTPLRCTAAATVAVLAGTLLAAPTAGAWDGHTLTERVDVAPGVVREVYREATESGPAGVQVLRFRLDDPRVSVKPELAGGTVPGKETVAATVRRLGPSAVAGVNANFFNPACRPTQPVGDPCGLVVRDGLVVSENVKNGGSWPGSFVLFPPGSGRDRLYAVGNEGFAGIVDFPVGDPFTINGVDRQPEWNELIAFNAGYGASTGTPSDTVEVLLGDLVLDAHTFGEFAVSQVRTGGNSPIPARGTVLAARGQTAAHLEAAARAAQEQGRHAYVQATTSRVEWSGAHQGIGAGPTILRNGQLTSSSDWFSEGFGLAHHERHPRTVVGFTPGGEMLLVTVDGRGAGGSVGMTTVQTGHLMQHLGAVDAVMLDGGGSTTMSVDGGVVNVPSGGERAVASSLVLHTNVPTPAVGRLSGPDRFATAAAIARTGWPNGVGTVVLASGALFPDALSGGPLAGQLGAPLLLVERDRVNPATAAAIASLRPRRALVLGGPSVITDAVLAELRGQVSDVRRIWGPDRTATAAAVARERGTPGRRAFLASAETFPDALSAAVPATRAGAPLLLTWRDRLAGPAAEALTTLGVQEVLVAGGPAAVSDAVVGELQARGLTVSRVAGEDRFQTSARLVDWAITHTGLPAASIVLASGSNFPDALAGGPFGVQQQAGLLLTHPLDVSRSRHTRAWLDARDLDRGWLLGGRLALSSWVGFGLQAAIDAR